MFYDDVNLLEGSKFVNLVIPSGTEFPSNADDGELFYITSSSTLYLYKVDTWESVGSNAAGGAYVGTSAPSSPTEGQLFFNTQDQILRIYVGSSWVDISSSTSGTIGDAIPEIRTPYNISPANNSTDLTSVNIVSSDYLCAYDLAFNAIQYQISGDSLFSSIVYSSGDIIPPTLINSVDAVYLDYSTIYYWRVRYKNSEGVYSNWSTPTSFTTHSTTLLTARTTWNLKNHNGDYTALLIRGDGNNGDTTTTDLAGHSPVIFNSGTQISNLQSKFGSTSIKFTGNGMTVGYKLDAFGDFYVDGVFPFTIEMWVYPTQLSGEMVLIENFTGSSGPNWTLYTSGSVLQFYSAGTVATATITTSNSLNVNSWNHVAIVGNSSNIRIYINGTLGVTGTATTTYSNQMAVPLWIGRRNSGGAGFVGYMNDIHIRMGVAKYSGSSFSVPTAEVPLPTSFGKPDRIYKSNKIITTTSDDFEFKININYTQLNYNGFVGIGFHNSTDDIVVRGAEIANTAALGHIYRKDVLGGGYSTASRGSDTGLQLSMVKTANQLVCNVHTGSGTVKLSHTYTLVAGKNYIPFLYHFVGGSNGQVGNNSGYTTYYSETVFDNIPGSFDSIPKP